MNTAYDNADRLVLARVPKDRIRERDAYEIFVRVEPNGDVIWSRDIADRGAVFSNAGAVSRSHVTYSLAVKRYLLVMIGPGKDLRFAGGFGVYDAPEGWGRGAQLFTQIPGMLGRANRSLFPPSGSQQMDGRRGSCFPAMTVSQSAAAH